MNQIPIFNTDGIEMMVVNIEGEKYVPIEPLCDFFGISEESESHKVLEDDFFSSRKKYLESEGWNGNAEKLPCIPLEVVFFWMFLINPREVAPDAFDTLVAYKRVCFMALDDHFNGTLPLGL